MLKDKLKNAKDLFKKVKLEYLIVAALAVAALIIIPNAFKTGDKEANTDNDIAEYVATLEDKLERCLKTVNGVGNVNVIISVASGVEQVYATEVTKDASGKTTESPLIIGGKPIVKMESFPEIIGVVIVADGANNLTVKMNLLNACKVFLSIDESKIKVLST